MPTGIFYEKIAAVLSGHFQQPITINGLKPLLGGSINEAYQLQTSCGHFFIKINNTKRYPGMFKQEAKGLELLKNAKAIKIPKVILTGESDDTSFIILEFIAGAVLQPGFWQTFGQQLAQLHQHTNDSFGLDYDNYIGSLHQNNQQHATWPEFFINERLQAQIKMARDHHQMDSSVISKFENLFSRLNELFPNEPPALLHGDLWSGNFMTGNNGEPVIMDPAVYYGHREMDLAMTKLFGGFDNQLYRSYHEQYPLEKGWEERVDICNLYPLMVHVNLFGGSYLLQVKRIVNRF